MGVWNLDANYLSLSTTLWQSAANKFNLVGDPLDIFEWAGPAGDQNCLVTRDTTVTDSPYGGVPLKMDVTGSDPHIRSFHTNEGGPWNIATAANGETWEVRVLAKGSVSTTIEFFIFGASSSGFWDGSSGSIGSGARNITTSWAEYSFQYTFGSSSVQAIQTRLDGPNAGSLVDVWFDGLQVYKVSA